MIDESCYWKTDLLKAADSLRLRKSQQRWPAASFARLEQTVMLGFYSIRKLIEASKLSNVTFGQELPVISYPCIGKEVTRMNTHKVDELYDLSLPTKTSFGVRYVCNQIIHSFVFMPVFEENGKLDSIFFTSDKKRHKQLLLIELVQIIRLFTQVGSDYPNEMKMSFNCETRDYDVTAKMHRR